jgi:hypothetical protein
MIPAGKSLCLLLSLVATLGCEGQRSATLDAGSNAINEMDASICSHDGSRPTSSSCSAGTLIEVGVGVSDDVDPELALLAACQLACRVSSQVMCQQQQSEATCVSVCTEQGARCFQPAVALFQCVGALSPLDLVCQPVLGGPILREGKCETELMAYASCQLAALINGPESMRP